MSGAPIAASRGAEAGQPSLALSPLAWNIFAASIIALAACLVLIGRAWPTQATLGWLTGYVLFFTVALVWLTLFSIRLGRLQAEPRRLLRTLVAVEGPLSALALIGSLAVYLSDQVNHQLSYFLQPTPTVALLLVALGTAVAQEVAVRASQAGTTEALQLALADCRRWALPLSLLLLGLLQGASYLWVIGNDYTRYWAVADAISSRVGYPAAYNQPVYVAEGMDRYSIELPLFPLLLLLAYTLVGHDTLAAHLPALLANTLFPLLLHALYCRAGFGRPLAFAAATIVAVFPFFRLYTLNAPVPDAVFVTLLVAAGYLLLRLIGDREQRWLPWPAFGVVAGLTALTRAEGMLYAAAMFLALLPYLSKLRLYLAGIAFLATIAPFSVTMMAVFGKPWPHNAGSSFSLHYITENLDWLWWLSVPWYAAPFGLSPSVFGLVVAFLTALCLAGTLWMLRERWQLAALPTAAGLQIATVFTVSPRVAGADQWFDFFRHISYGIPFAVLPLLFLVSRLSVAAPPARWVFTLPLGRLRPRFGILHLVALLGLAFTAYLLHLLAHPSQTWGSGAGQLLTSDVWVSFHDLVSNRYPLLQLPFVPIDGVLMIDPSFEYIPRHLESVKAFYEPYSSIVTGRGSQYEVSSLLVLLFGAVFALMERPRRRINCSGDGDDVTARQRMAPTPGATG